MSHSPQQQALVFFDAHCSLCWRTQKLLASWGKSGALQFIPLQLFEIYQKQFSALRTVSIAELQQGIRVFNITDNKLYIGVAGVAYCLQQCRFPYSVLGKLLVIQWLQPILVPLYEWVANNRTKLLPPLSETEAHQLFETLSTNTTENL